MSDHKPVCDMGCDNPNCTLLQCVECGEDWPCEVVRLRAELAEAKAEARHLANNLDVQRAGRIAAEAKLTAIRELCDIELDMAPDDLIQRKVVAAELRKILDGGAS